MTQYHLERFEEFFDLWETAEGPPESVRLVVLDWMFTRYESPYLGADRQADFENYWYCPIPGSGYDGNIVVCAYWIFERERRIRCDALATLGSPA